MSRCGVSVLVGAPLALLMASPAARAQSFAPVGNLDCNGYSQIQKPLRPHHLCTDFHGEYGEPGNDNGHYIGHDEPSIGFISTTPGSGNDVRWEFTLPVEQPVPATQSFENFAAFWFSMALCDPNSFPYGACIPNSDQNNPKNAGSAILELQFYPPGFPPFITQISCDLTHWCAALNIDSISGNDSCFEPVNFAFIQKNGVPTGPPGPASATDATFTPNAQTLLMNQGDRIRITIQDTPAGLRTTIADLTTGQTGFIVASAANGFQSLDPATCAPTSFSFRPEYDTAKFGNFVPWAALQANINFAMEIGHFELGASGDSDADDAPCFPGPTVAGCIGADTDFDGTSYRLDWPDGTSRNASSIAIGSATGLGIGPLSVSPLPPGRSPVYGEAFPIIQFETTISGTAFRNGTCMPNGVGCVIPPVGAKFYPFFALNRDGDANSTHCTLLFGNFRSGPELDNFGGDAQYGASNLYWFFGQNSRGPQSNPCPPPPQE